MDSAQDDGDEGNSSALSLLSPYTPYRRSARLRKTVILPPESPPTRRKRGSPRKEKEKLEALTQGLSPIPFVPKRENLNIASHEDLLKLLGLWDFLNLDFDHEIRTDLIRELMRNYEPKCNLSRVRGKLVFLRPAPLAAALSLRAKRYTGNSEVIGQAGDVEISQEEASFLKQLIWGCLILKDDEDSEVGRFGYIVTFCKLVNEKRFQEIYWARLIWTMVKKELLKGDNLGNCYYASHLQRLLKHQRPELFEMEKEEKAEVKSYPRRTRSSVKLTEQRKMHLEEDMVENWREKLRKQQTSADLIGGKFGLEQKMEDANQDVSEHDTCGVTKRRKFSTPESDIDFKAVDLACSADGSGNVAEALMALIVNQKSHEEGLKIESSTDLTISSVFGLGRTEIDYQPCTLIPKEEPAATNINSGEMIEHEVTDKISVSHENFGPQMEHCVINELTTVCGQSENEVLVNEEGCQTDIVDSLDSREKLPNAQVVLNAMKHATDSDIALKETDYQQTTNKNCLKRGEEIFELKMRPVNNFQNFVSEESMQVTLSAGSQNVEERKKDEVMDLNARSLSLMCCNEEDVVENKESKAAECESIQCSHEIQCDKDVLIEDKAAKAECKASFGTSLDMYYNESDDVVDDKANEATSEAKVGGLLDVRSGKEDDAIHDKGNEATIGHPYEIHCKRVNGVMEDKANEAACETNVGDSLKLQCEKQDDVMHDEANEAACEANVVASLEVYCKEENYLMEHEVNEASCKATNGVTLDFHSGKEDYVLEDKVTEASSEPNIGDSVALHRDKEGYVMEDIGTEGNIVDSLDWHCENVMEDKVIEAVSEANVGDSIDLCCEKEYYYLEAEAHEATCVANTDYSLGEASLKLQDHDELKLQCESRCDRNGGSLTDFGCDKMYPQQVALNALADINGKNVESTASLDLLMTREAPKDSAITKRMIDAGDGYAHECMDLDFITGQLELWTGRLKNASERKIQESHEINTMLLKKVKDQSHVIQQHETLRRNEQLQKQKDVYKYERELMLMHNVLQDYRKALKEAHKSFASYRERCQLPDSSLYMPHPAGGGRLMLVADWEKMMQKSQEDAIRAMVNNFEEVCFGRMQELCEKLDTSCDRLEDLEFAVSSLKWKDFKAIEHGH